MAEITLTEIVHRSDFDAVGITTAEPLEQEQFFFRQWLNAGMDAGLSYLKNSIDLRHDARNIFPDVQSIIVTLTAIKRVAPHTPTIAAFAHNFGDYHHVIKERLNRLLRDLQQADSTITGRAVVDSAPIFEKALAVKAGLGWIGRNSLLINPTLGSYTHIGLLMINRPLPANLNIIPNRCSESCNLCRQACPNHAINDNRTIDCRRCIAALTIEKSETYPPTHHHIFGCDRCMEACPYNRQMEVIEPTITNIDWLTITEAEFRKRFRNTSLARVKLEKIKRVLEAEQDRS